MSQKDSILIQKFLNIKKTVPIGTASQCPCKQATVCSRRVILASVRIASVCARRELTVPMVVMHSVSDFTECIPIKINIKTSKQIHTLPFSGTSSKLKHRSILVYLATA